MSQLIVSSDLGEFFHSRVSEARGELGVEISETAEFYLVNLLCDYSKPTSAPRPGEEPLAFIYKRALESAFAERLQLFKNLGDVSLYVAGFFREYIERSGLDRDYYISMGTHGYSNLSSMMNGMRKGDTLAHLYDQLARTFDRLVAVLTEIAHRSRDDQASTDAEIVKLYDRWMRTGSERIRKLLLDRGLAPHAVTPGDLN